MLKKSLYILGILIVLALYLFAGFLVKGIHIEGISFENFILKECSIRWQKGLLISIDSLTILPTSNDSGNDTEYINPKLYKHIKILHAVGRAVSSIKIGSIDSSIFAGEFEYISSLNGDLSFFNLLSPDLQVLIKTRVEDDTFIFHLDKIASTQYKSRLQGIIEVDTTEERVAGSIEAVLAGDTLPLHLDFSADNKGVVFTGKGGGDVTSIKPIIDLFPLDPEVVPWINDYLDGSLFDLKKFNGEISWKDPASILQTFYAEGRVSDCKYIFAEGFNPIFSSYTDVVYENGVLKIYPHEATFYGQKTEKSWLDIDFKDPDEPILNIYIDTHAVLNQDILNLLKFYDIDLPIRQLSGQTQSDLFLSVNLMSEDVEAEGRFTFGKGVIQYIDQELHTTGGDVLIKNSEVKIQNVHFTLPDLLSSKLSGTIDILDEKGKLTFDLENFSYTLDEGTLRLKLDNNPVKLVYSYDQDEERVALSKTHWQFNTLNFELDGFTAPFDSTNFSINLPTTKLFSEEHSCIAMVKGTFSVDPIIADLWLDLVHYRKDLLVLQQPLLQMHVVLDEIFRVSTQEKGRWSIGGVDSIIDPFDISFSNDNVSLAKTRIAYGDFIASDLRGKFNITTDEGTLFLSSFTLSNESLGTLLALDDEVAAKVKHSPRKLVANLPQLGTAFYVDQSKVWNVECSNLQLLYKSSPLLQRFGIANGNINFGSNSGTLPFSIQGILVPPFRILVDGDSAYEQLAFTGRIDEHGITTVINDKVSAHFADKIQIQSSDIEVNVGQLLRYIDMFFQSDSQSPIERVDLEVIAKNTSLFLKKDNRALADVIYIIVRNGKTFMRLEHQEGKAWLFVDDKHLSFSGEKFNGNFIEGLLREASFSGGELSFSGKGTVENFTGLFLVKDTVLEDYSLMNNIFAFVNTIPALITFSFPEYSTKGMSVSSAVLNLHYNNKLFEIDTLAIDSKPLDIYGTGTANLLDDTVDMDINLITTAKENISKIPFVGYVLVGEKKLPSITLKVTGKINDPKVSSTAFKDYIAWPVKTVFRAIKLPFNIIEEIFSSEEGKAPPIGVYPFDPSTETHSE
ncbi:MAG: DUF3971 domain-containing protein [Bacteroidetes bacterium]|nr:DUF3971 domain-containing protein [Bacteroidota bacterium]